MDWETLERVVNYSIAAIASVAAAVFARRKSKEDSNLAEISKAVMVWKDLAQTNRTQWADCEKLNEQLDRKVQNIQTELWAERRKTAMQQIKIDRLEAQVLTLQEQVRGWRDLDEGPSDV